MVDPELAAFGLALVAGWSSLFVRPASATPKSIVALLMVALVWLAWAGLLSLLVVRLGLAPAALLAGGLAGGLSGAAAHGMLQRMIRTRRTFGRQTS